MKPRARARGLLLVVASTFGAALIAIGPGPAAAVGVIIPPPTSVSGSACSYYTSVSLFGGPYNLLGCGQQVGSPATAASPLVTTPPAGGTRTATDPDGAIAQYGPAKLFSGQYPNAANDPGDVLPSPPSGPQSATTTGTIGSGGGVTSTASIVQGTQGTVDPTQPRGIGPAPVIADAASATCTANESGFSGSASFTNGILVTSTIVGGPNDGAPLTTEPIPSSPGVNYTRTGAINNVGDTFTVKFNEQIVGPNSITVNAVHEILEGPTAIGDLVVGQVKCALAGHSVADFTGDGKTDFSIFRPSDGAWYVSDGTNGFWGTSGDIPVPGDYNGDGKTEFAVFRPSTGAWYILGGTSAFWGTSGDIPVPADYNGDGTTDIAVFRPSTGAWYVLNGPSAFWGTSGDIPVPGDYNADGKADFAVFRPSNNAWYTKLLTHGGAPIDAWKAVLFGTSGDIPVPGDYNGDGQTDVAVYRPSTGAWYVYGDGSALWGSPGDVPEPGDYDGNGITDFATYQPSSHRWAVAGGAAKIWGLAGDLPLPLPYAIRNVFFPIL